jgi:hypothetical protein
MQFGFLTVAAALGFLLGALTFVLPFPLNSLLGPAAVIIAIAGACWISISNIKW